MENGNNLDARYWQSRYLEGNTPWDLGAASPAITAYLSGLQDKSARILIPGAGKAWEALWLLQHGFRQVFICDWAEAAFEEFRQQVPDFPAEHLLVCDFFALDPPYDIIIEQTFVSAIPPVQWKAWAAQCARLLEPGGRVAGLLFASPFTSAGPPFGADREDYLNIFGEELEILRMERTDLSIAPRLGNELFFEATPRKKA